MKKLEILTKIEECLRDSPVAESFSDDWRARLIQPHREYPERTRQILTVMSVCWGQKDGWFTIRQAGGGWMVVMYAPELKRGSDSARQETDALKRCLDQILPSNMVQIRAAEPPAEIKRLLNQQVA